MATLRPLAVGDRVMMRAKGKWEPATVIAISQDGPHSYIVNTPGGQSYRRNRRHLKPTPCSLNAKRHYQADHSWLHEYSACDFHNKEHNHLQYISNGHFDDFNRFVHIS